MWLFLVEGLLVETDKQDREVVHKFYRPYKLETSMLDMERKLVARGYYVVITSLA